MVRKSREKSLLKLSKENPLKRVRSGMKIEFFPLVPVNTFKRREENSYNRGKKSPTEIRAYNRLVERSRMKNVFTVMNLTIIRFSSHSDINT